jgi:hypothetical protein
MCMEIYNKGYCRQQSKTRNRTVNIVAILLILADDNKGK